MAAAPEAIPVSAAQIHERKSRTIEEAESELSRLQKIEQDILAELETLADKYEAAGGAVGDKILDARLKGDEQGMTEANQDLTRTWLEMDTIHRAARAAHTATIHAERNLYLARAEEIQHEADALKVKIDNRTAKFNELLKALRDFDEYPYQIYPPIPPRQGAPQRQPKTAILIEDYKNRLTRIRSLQAKADHLEQSAKDPRLD